MHTVHITTILYLLPFVSFPASGPYCVATQLVLAQIIRFTTTPGSCFEAILVGHSTTVLSLESRIVPLIGYDAGISFLSSNTFLDFFFITTVPPVGLSLSS